jgi:hypothetical protein
MKTLSWHLETFSFMSEYLAYTYHGFARPITLE